MLAQFSAGRNLSQRLFIRRFTGDSLSAPRPEGEQTEIPEQFKPVVEIDFIGDQVPIPAHCLFPQLAAKQKATIVSRETEARGAPIIA